MHLVMPSAYRGLLGSSYFSTQKAAGSLAPLANRRALFPRFSRFHFGVRCQGSARRPAEKTIRVLNHHHGHISGRSEYDTKSYSPGGSKNQVSIPLDGKIVEFDSIFLRDSCQCSSCVDVSTSQKHFQTSDIPIEIQGSFVEIQRHAGSYVAVIQWMNDIESSSAQHKSIIPLSLLRKTKSDCRSRHIAHFNPSNRVFWERSSIINDNLFVEFDKFLASEEELLRAMKRIESHGLVFLRNVPDCSSYDSSDSLNKIVARIGPIRSTFYGLTWDVKSVPGAINVAYTHKYLGLHMDLCYMDLTPQFQFLHSLRARAPGG